MHKSNQFLKSGKEILQEQNIIFLDIESIMKIDSQKRFSHDLKKLKEYLSINYRDDIYNQLNDNDIGTAYFDFDNISIGILHELVERYNANIVISSNWNNTKTKDEFQAIFKLYNLDRFIIDVINTPNKIQKQEAIKEYIAKHQIKKYMLFDNYDYTTEFGEQFRRTNNVLRINDINYANLLFNQRLTIFEDHSHIYLLLNGKPIITFKYDNYDNNGLKLLCCSLESMYCLEYGGKQYIEYFLNYLTKEKDVDFILLSMNDIRIDDLNISGALDSNNIYTINKSTKDIKHSISETKRKILSINNC